MLIFTVLVLATTVLSMLFYRRTGGRPAGSTNVVDRDADRIETELRAILGVHEYH